MLERTVSKHVAPFWTRDFGTDRDCLATLAFHCAPEFFKSFDSPSTECDSSARLRENHRERDR